MPQEHCQFRKTKKEMFSNFNAIWNYGYCIFSRQNVSIITGCTLADYTEHAISLWNEQNVDRTFFLSILDCLYNCPFYRSSYSLITAQNLALILRFENSYHICPLQHHRKQWKDHLFSVCLGPCFFLKHLHVAIVSKIEKLGLWNVYCAIATQFRDAHA